MVKLGLQQVLGLFGYEKLIYQQSDLSIQLLQKLTQAHHLITGRIK
jgi:hypothetical protein